MAERRMFARKIIDSDAFLEMSASAQALYFHLGTRADDDGFVSNPKKIQRLVRAADDDFRILIAKSFIIVFDSGVIVIRHWRIHNYIQNDRYKPTIHAREKAMLDVGADKSYIEKPVDALDTSCIQNVSKLDTQRIQTPSDSRGDNRGDIAHIANKDYIYNIYIESESDIEQNNTKSIARSDKIASAPEAIPVITLPLNDNSQHPITQAEVDRFSELYPAVDVPQALRAMAGWLETNPTKRKTRRGVMRFVNSWLSRDQDKGGTRGYSGSPASAQKPSVKYD